MWDTYTTVLEIPIAFPNFKIALLLCTCKQTPQQGWCVAPPSLAYRFWPDGQLSFCGLLEDVEVAMSYVRKCATAVAAETVGGTEQEHRHRKAKITAIDAEMDIALVKLIVDQPKQKKVDGKDVHQQQDLLSETCAGLVADTLRQLQTLSPKFDFPESARDSRMLNRSFELLESGASQVTAREGAAVAVPDKAAPMVPTAALVDADGRVRARVDNVCRKPLPPPTVEI